MRKLLQVVLTLKDLALLAGPIRITRFSSFEQKVHVYELNFRRMLSLGLAIALIPAIMVSVALPGFSFMKESIQLHRLRTQNDILRRTLAGFDERLQALDQKFNYMRQRENHLRTFAALPEIDEDVWQVGTGGNEASANLQPAYADPEISGRFDRVESLMDAFEKKIELLDYSFAEMETKMSRDQLLRDHTPSINPVPEGAISSKFGLRMDPFTRQLRQHNGLDIIAAPGTPVLAPADGIVSFARRNYDLNEDFGKMVIINHGNGIYSRFGHLSNISVKRGQKVKRYDAIGEVGNTGRSTGPHLHYEIFANGEFQNPLAYILN